MCKVADKIFTGILNCLQQQQQRDAKEKDKFERRVVEVGDFL